MSERDQPSGNHFVDRRPVAAFIDPGPDQSFSFQFYLFHVIHMLFMLTLPKIVSVYTIVVLDVIGMTERDQAPGNHFVDCVGQSDPQDVRANERFSKTTNQ